MPVPTTDELTDFIEDPLRAKLQANRNIGRKNRRRNAFIMAVVLLLFLPVAIGATIWHGSTGNEFLGSSSSVSIPILLALVFALLYIPLRLRYSAEEIPFQYTPDVVAPLVHFIEPRLSYSPDGGIEGDEFADAGILDAPMKSFESRHLFSGRLRDAEVRLASVEARTKATAPFLGRGDGEFQGPFASVRFPAEFDATTMLIPRSKPPNGDTPPTQPKVVFSAERELEPVELDDRDFDTRFDLRTESPREAPRWLSEPVVKRLTVLHDAFRTDDSDRDPSFSLLVRGDRLFFACRKRSYFKRSDSRFSLDTTHLHRLGRQIRALVDVVEFMVLSLERK